MKNASSAYSAVIHISASQNCISNAGITEIEFFRAFQILLATNIKPLDIIENKSIAKILNVFAHSNMIGYSLTGSQKLADLVRGGQIADVVHEKLAESLQDQSIRQGVFLNKLSGYDGFVDLFGVICSVFFCTVGVGACETALYCVFFKEFISIADFIVILTVFLKTEREHMDLEIASGEEGCQVRTQQKGVGTGNVDIVFPFGIQAVDGQLKLGTHLYFVYKKVVCFSFLIMLLDVGMQGMVPLDLFIG